jgi:hypothetical protein
MGGNVVKWVDGNKSRGNVLPVSKTHPGRNIMNLYLLTRFSAGYGELETALAVAESENDARMFVLKYFRSEVDATAFLFGDESKCEMLGSAADGYSAGNILHSNRAAQ